MKRLQLFEDTPDGDIKEVVAYANIEGENDTYYVFSLHLDTNKHLAMVKAVKLANPTGVYEMKLTLPKNDVIFL